MHRSEHVFIPFDAEGHAFYSNGKVRVYRTIESAEKQGFFADSLVEYAPVRRGMWITEANGVTICSNCGEEHEWDEYRPFYCEYCGSRMDGENNDKE